MEGVSPVTLGLMGRLAAGSMTAIGALPVLFSKGPNRAVRDLALGFAAGVMLAASFFSLIIPSLEASELRYGGSVLPAAIACAAILMGMGLVALLNERLPHEHFEQGREGP
jgi:ZIP family zinc transporter